MKLVSKNEKSTLLKISKINESPAGSTGSFQLATNISQDFHSEIEKENSLLRCNCTKSQCLKLYCECFAKGKCCNQFCHCENCKNSSNNYNVREQIMQSIVLKNPLAFHPKNEFLQKYSFLKGINDERIKEKGMDLLYRGGCKCRKSFCRKKYCECFINNLRCTEFCKCQGCRNRYQTKFSSKSHQNPQKTLKNLNKKHRRNEFDENFEGNLERKNKLIVVEMKENCLEEIKNLYFINKRVQLVKLSEDFLENNKRLSEINSHFKQLLH